ncbi:MAG: hypothetical protein II882_01470 [Lachnospiraceae bacterium]|nr:hypothetical protein [Lachnospiraceae bacterium]
MKKISIGLAALLLAAALAACGAEKDSTEAAEKTTGAVRTQEASEKETVPAETEPAVISTGIAPGEDTKAQESASQAPTEEEPPLPGGAVSEEDFVIVYHGVELRVGEIFDAEAQKESMGVPVTEQGQACIGGGYDTNYYYDDSTVGVLTIARDGAQVIYDVYTGEAGYKTARGAEIGVSTREEVRALYGEPTSSAVAADKYSLNGTTVLSFSFSGGILSEIDLSDTSIS